jgi:copper transporter 1
MPPMHIHVPSNPPSMTPTPETCNAMMHMTFYSGVDVQFLFDWWCTNDIVSYLTSVFVLFCIAFLNQFVYSLLKIRPKTSVNGYVQLTEGETEQKVISTGKVGLYKLLRAIFYFVFLSVAYFLMLAIMTYNVGVFFAIVLGSALGYAVFIIRPDDMSSNQEQPPAPTCHQ